MVIYIESSKKSAKCRTNHVELITPQGRRKQDQKQGSKIITLYLSYEHVEIDITNIIPFTMPCPLFDAILHSYKICVLGKLTKGSMIPHIPEMQSFQ